MHEHVVQVAVGRPHVLLRGKASQTLLVDVDSQGIHSVDQRVYSQVEFQVVYQIGLVEVSLGYILFSLLEIDVLKAPYQKYSPALAHMSWFYDEGLGGLLLRLKLLLELGHLRGKNPRLGEDVVVLTEYPLHPD